MNGPGGARGTGTARRTTGTYGEAGISGLDLGKLGGAAERVQPPLDPDSVGGAVLDPAQCECLLPGLARVLIPPASSAGLGETGLCAGFVVPASPARSSCRRLSTRAASQ
jgi:hypothetical protein